MDNTKFRMQGCHSAKNFGDKGFGDSYRKLLVRVDVLDIDGHIRSEYLCNDALMSTVGTFDPEVVEEFDDIFSSVMGEFQVVVPFEMSKNSDLGDVHGDISRENFECGESA